MRPADYVDPDHRTLLANVGEDVLLDASLQLTPILMTSVEVDVLAKQIDPKNHPRGIRRIGAFATNNFTQEIEASVSHIQLGPIIADGSLNNRNDVRVPLAMVFDQQTQHALEENRRTVYDAHKKLNLFTPRVHSLVMLSIKGQKKAEEVADRLELVGFSNPNVGIVLRAANLQLI